MIKVTLGEEQKQEERPFPKLMVIKKGVANEGTIVLFKEPEIGFLIRGVGHWEGCTVYTEKYWAMKFFTDYNGPVTIQNA